MKKFFVYLLVPVTVFWVQDPALAVPGFAWNISTLSLYPSQCASTVADSFRNPANLRRPVIRRPGQAYATNIQEMAEQRSPGVFFGQGFDNDTGVSVWCTPSDIPLCSRTASSLIIFAVSDRGSGVAQAAVERLRAQIGNPQLIDCSP